MGLGLSRQPGIMKAAASFYLWEGILCAALMLAMVWTLAKIAKREQEKYDFSDFGKTFVDELQGRTWIKKGFFVLSQLIRRDSYAFAFIFFPLLGRPDWVLHLLSLGVLAYIFILLVKFVNGRRSALGTTPIEYAGQQNEAGEPYASKPQAG